MKLALTQCKTMQFCESVDRPAPVREDHLILTVSFCAVCRTDAKMWREGHRDLALPRVLGHEITGVDESSGRMFTIWPGEACGQCRYCRMGRENLCEAMRIIGFHTDGGFARYVSVPRQSLVPVNGAVASHLLTFAEPLACVINGLSHLAPKQDERIIIYGGGVVGMLAALVARERKCRVTVIEKSQEKIARLQGLCDQNGIGLIKATVEADFDMALICCDSPIAFSLGITKLRKAGRFGYFSGLEKNEQLDTVLLNLIHYKELEVYGSYGPRRAHMAQAVDFCLRRPEDLAQLIERVVRPQEVESILPHVLSGNALKYIVDFTAAGEVIPPGKRSSARLSPVRCGMNSLPEALSTIFSAVEPASASWRDRAQRKVDMKTKPLGALGRIEELAVQLCAIQKRLEPRVDCRRMFVFAGDHGVVEEGVSAFPAKVTVQMVRNFLEGGAAINCFCRQYGIELAVVDMGVKGDFDDHPLLIKRKLARGTRNFTVQRAMTPQAALTAIEYGARTFLEGNQTEACQLVGMGEMGIGNTSSATAIICGVSGLAVHEVAGWGTGIDNKGLARKREVIERALALHKPAQDDALDLLSAVGGYELGGICGAVLAAAASGCCVVLDGIISTAAGLLAYLLCPEVKEYLVAGHRSVETGQRAALEIMGLEPVVDLDMRLGEGTGAAITMNLIDLACRMMREMASFEEAGVDGKLS
jgi:nicotinate-nucleotide--dimethylbenzimidazole phosphoribosyltransferase